MYFILEEFKLSKGIGGGCRKVLEDDNIIIYEYFSYNLNIPKYRNDKKIFDGIITIEKASFIEPEIHRKLKKFRNGKKKLIIKRVCSDDIPLESLLSNGKITIENTRNCWMLSNEGYDFIALHFCYDILKRYQKDGEVPEKLSYDV